MKQTIYELTAPRTLVGREEPLDTASLQPQEIIAATELSLISTGTELAAWLGKPPLRPSRAYPRLMGYCNVARVLQVGSAVSEIAPGDYVLTHQSHRSHWRATRRDVLLAVSEASVQDRRKLVTTYLYHLGYVALLEAGYVPGHEVAIVGLGALGFTTASLVIAFGGQPLVFTGRPDSPLPACLARATLLPKSELPQDWWTRRRDLDGADVVVNTSDVWSDHLLCMKLARKGGTIALLGFPGRGASPPQFNPLDSQYLYDKQLTIKQVGHVTDAELPAIDRRFTLQRNLRYLFNLLRAGAVDPTPLLAPQVSWRDLARAYDALSARPRGVYSTLVDWTC